ncbi:MULTISPECIES: endonuclease domain-containing protein [unclassified Pseudactinotalea]|uniref:endonuclease domain-containing protein n=1 Tax=unclassified Pseudactinotalea TaxID=2649176 RepID=UPI003C7AFD8C
MASLDRTRPFTVRQALAAGVTPASLKNPRHYRRLFRGVYVGAEANVDLQTRARAALLLHPSGAVASHTTAAALQRIPVPIDADVHVTVLKESHRRRRPGLHSHLRTEARGRVVDGVPCSWGAQLFTELAQKLQLVDLVIAGDAMVRIERVAPSVLVPATGPGLGRARRAAALVRSGVESPMETRVRLLLIWAGFPEPMINLALRHSAGTYRPDLCWPDLRLAVEYDGQHHRTDLDQWESDIRRREWFQSQGWTILTLISRDVFRQQQETIHRVHEAWKACGGAPFALQAHWQVPFGLAAVA